MLLNIHQLDRKQPAHANAETVRYQTIAFETGFSFSGPPTSRPLPVRGSPLNNFENLLLADSPLDWLPQVLFQRPPAHSYEGHRERVLFTFDKLATIPVRPGPKMVFAHIISPHPPFVFDAQGNAVQPPRSYSIGDGDDYRGDWEEYRQGYAGQVQFVNRMLEKNSRCDIVKVFYTACHPHPGRPRPRWFFGLGFPRANLPVGTRIHFQRLLSPRCRGKRAFTGYFAGQFISNCVENLFRCKPGIVARQNLFPFPPFDSPDYRHHRPA